MKASMLALFTGSSRMTRFSALRLPPQGSGQDASSARVFLGRPGPLFALPFGAGGAFGAGAAFGDGGAFAPPAASRGS